jgi:3-isopropylmalate dehydrogenase
MNTYKIAVLKGDGIGPEIVDQAIAVLEAAGRKFNIEFDYSEGLIGGIAIDTLGSPFPAETQAICEKADAILFGAIGDPKFDNNPKANMRPEQGLLAMRKTLGLFANIRPVAAYDNLLNLSPLKEHITKGADFVVIRELTGGIYFGEPRGRSENGATAFDTCVYTKEEITRVAKMAFEYAMTRRKKLTVVDKANVLATSRLWRETVQVMEKDYPQVAVDYMFVDNAAMRLILQPTYFDVVLTENMFGDILTDEASVITGSLGMLPSASKGAKVSLYEPIHGSYPQAKGKGIANPIATILSVAMMLEDLGETIAGKAIRMAVDKVVAEGFLTVDLNSANPKSTTEVGRRIAELI